MGVRFTDCPLCGHHQFQTLAPCSGGPLERCDACRLVFRNPAPDDEELSHSYERLYYPHDGGTVAYDVTPDALLAQYAERISDRIGGVRGCRILDVGCGDGAFGSLLTGRGAAVSGVELDDVARNRITAFPAYKTLEAVPEGTFDLITMIVAIEHLREPWEDLARLRARLAPGAWIFVTTPSLGALRARLRGSRWSQAENPTHLYLFTEQTLRRVFSRAGYQDIERFQMAYDYPGHGRLRGVLDRALCRLGLDGHLQMFGR